MRPQKKNVGHKSSATNKYAVYTSSEYFTKLQVLISKAGAGDRVVLVSLWLRAEQPPIAALIDELIMAARRGARITMVLDAFTTLIKQGMTPGPAFWYGPSARRGLFSPSFRARQTALDRLVAAGVECQIINQTSRPLANPFHGRSHIKYTIINDEVFIGGCNLADVASIDVMVSWHDTHIATELRDLTETIMSTGRVSSALLGKDRTIAIDKQTTLLIDAGVVGQSCILDAATHVIDAASRELLITYQYFPHGPIAECLRQAAARGVSLRVYYNHPLQHQALLSLLYGAMAHKERRNGPSEFSSHRLSRTHPYLHAKILASDKQLLFGSHNYMVSGVEFGTAEIAMISTDTELRNKIQAAFERQI